MGNVDCSFLVKVSIPDLNIRKGLERIQQRQVFVQELEYSPSWKLRAEKAQMPDGVD